MEVKDNGKQLSFLFQETDPYFEIGYKILEQAAVAQMLPCERKLQNGRNKIVFHTDSAQICPLSEAVLDFQENDIINALCELFVLIQNVEENGFLKKECIWCSYGHIFYHTGTKRILAAVLPITREFRYADGMNWHGRFQETLSKIARNLPKKKTEKVARLAQLFQQEKLACGEVLEELNRLGSGMSGILGNKEAASDTKLRLFYSGRKGKLEFFVEDGDYVIGRNPEEVCGVIPEEVSRAVSRRHCMIMKLNGKFFVQDLDSTNYTFVNGTVIPAYEFMELVNNDILSLADIEFRVSILEVNSNICKI